MQYQFKDKVEFRYRRLKILITLIIIVFGYLKIMHDLYDYAFSADSFKLSDFQLKFHFILLLLFITMFACYLLFYFGRMFLRKNPAIIINRNGFVCKNFSGELIPWKNVKSARVVKNYSSNVIEVVVENPSLTSYQDRKNLFDASLVRFLVRLDAFMIDTKFDELKNAFGHYRSLAMRNLK